MVFPAVFGVWAFSIKSTYNIINVKLIEVVISTTSSPRVVTRSKDSSYREKRIFCVHNNHQTRDVSCLPDRFSKIIGSPSSHTVRRASRLYIIPWKFYVHSIFTFHFIPQTIMKQKKKNKKDCKTYRVFQFYILFQHCEYGRFFLRQWELHWDRWSNLMKNNYERLKFTSLFQIKTPVIFILRYCVFARFLKKKKNRAQFSF